MTIGAAAVRQPPPYTIHLLQRITGSCAGQLRLLVAQSCVAPKQTCAVLAPRATTILLLDLITAPTALHTCSHNREVGPGGMGLTTLQPLQLRCDRPVRRPDRMCDQFIVRSSSRWARSSDVGSQGETGKHLPGLSPTGIDPKRPFILLGRQVEYDRGEYHGRSFSPCPARLWSRSGSENRPRCALARPRRRKRVCWSNGG